MNIVGFTGSLRKKSYNMAILKTIAKLMPQHINFEILDLSNIPFFNEDITDIPDSVRIFNDKLSKADGIIISTPEYNYSIPPVLKNALDWASRSEYQPLSGKPLAISSASIGIFGGVHSQMHLREVCVVLNLKPINRPEVYIGKANEKFDENENLTDEYTKKKIIELINSLITEIKNNYSTDFKDSTM